ncbi:SDR family oxidoreductase [Humitalea sp. 24SJ18S-53]|uniref:SDR family oxidoreductase n=1 Tax=Humitalea sp. 24SJ18S-53 TaxID=3422307 RepID=UPI003D6678A5
MQISLSGRRALVTGGSKGLGYAAAEGFLKAGASVALVARGAEALEAAREALSPLGPVIAVAADVATADGCKSAYAAAEAAFGGIDILLNNAGTSTRGPFPSVTDEMWQADLDLKLFGAIRLTRLVWPGMTERRWGRVINTLNTGAKVPTANGAPTAVSRAAGLSLTKILANEGAPVGILVNAILIGIIESDQWRRRHAAAVAAGSNQSWEDWLAEAGRAVPLGRMGKAEEFGNLATFLASDASAYTTGTAINLDGGRTPVV